MEWLGNPQKEAAKELFLWDTLLPWNPANQRSPGRPEVCTPSCALGSGLKCPQASDRDKGAGKVLQMGLAPGGTEGTDFRDEGIQGC